MTGAALAAFVSVCLLAYVIPGPDWLVVLHRSARGRRAGAVAALGVQAGLCIHMAAAAIGVSALVLSSATAFLVLKIAGAAYLVHLGLQALWRSRPVASSPAAPAADPTPSTTLPRVFGQAFLANVLNPKAALFFVSVLPQFVAPDQPIAAQVLLLGGIDIALGLVWWGVFVLLTGRLSVVLRRPVVRRGLDRVTGTALVGFGVTVAAS